MPFQRALKHPNWMRSVRVAFVENINRDSLFFCAQEIFLGLIVLLDVLLPDLESERILCTRSALIEDRRHDVGEERPLIFDQLVDFRVKTQQG